MVLDNYSDEFNADYNKSKKYLLVLISGSVVGNAGFTQLYKMQWVVFKANTLLRFTGATGYIVPLSDTYLLQKGVIDNVAFVLIQDVICSQSRSSHHRTKAMEYLNTHFNLLSTTVNQTDKTNLVSLCIEYFKNNLDEHISLDDLAQYTLKSKIAILKAFSREQGVAPLKVLAQMRIEEATRLLHQQQLSITQIGFKIGFSDVATFSHFYKRHTGKSPRSIQNELTWVI